MQIEHDAVMVAFIYALAAVLGSQSHQDIAPNKSIDREGMKASKGGAHLNHNVHVCPCPNHYNGAAISSIRYNAMVRVEARRLYLLSCLFTPPTLST